jgi:translation initiation factor 2B subunit (eIF-2B alpha/beta/delta family)
MAAPADAPVVTVFLRNRSDVLLLRLGPDAEVGAGRWDGVSGPAGDAPDAAAIDAIEREADVSADRVTLARRGEPVRVGGGEGDDGRTVHPYLFAADTRSVTPRTAEAAEWVAPTAMLERDCVPELWTLYRRVAPSVLSITDDEGHGSAALSMRALEVLRDRAGMLAASGGEDDAARARLASMAERLLEARPSMAALANRIHRVMHGSLPDLAPATVATRAHEALDEARQADAGAARHAADAIAGERVLTLSRSGTVLDALRRADPAPEVVVAESRPAREGVGVAEALSADGLDVTLITDAAAALMLSGGAVDAVLVGADTVLPTGAVVNKTGTRAAALAAARESVPVFAACAVDKISPTEASHGEEGNPRAVYDGPADLDVRNPTFDVTPADLVTGVFTERGRLAPGDIGPVADELERLRSWT